MGRVRMVARIIVGAAAIFTSSVAHNSSSIFDLVNRELFYYPAEIL